jgi:hypothetical protein
VALSAAALVAVPVGATIIPATPANCATRHGFTAVLGHSSKVEPTNQNKNENLQSILKSGLSDRVRKNVPKFFRIGNVEKLLIAVAGQMFPCKKHIHDPNYQHQQRSEMTAPEQEFHALECARILAKKVSRDNGYPNTGEKRELLRSRHECQLGPNDHW